MNEKMLAALIVSNVLPELRALPDMSAAVMAQSFQPRTQGRITTPVLYFFFLDANRYGWTGREDVADPLNPGQVTHTESQWYRQPIQFMPLVPQDPKNLTQLTAGDVAAAVSSIMASDKVRSAFAAQGVGMERITQVRNPSFVNDENRFEFAPSFDVVLTHKRSVVTAQPAALTFDYQIRRV